MYGSTLENMTRFFAYRTLADRDRGAVYEMHFAEATKWKGDLSDWEHGKITLRGNANPAKFGDEGMCIVLGVQRLCELLCLVTDDTEYLLFDDQEQAWTVVNLIDGVWVEEPELKEIGQ